MHEVLNHLPAGAFVLDLGCKEGSFSPAATASHVVRVDRDSPGTRGDGASFVQADAARLPFADGSFAAIVSNHSLEHFDDFAGALSEIGRVIAADGALFVAVPDASTLTDEVYRWLARGGGHVNAFKSERETAAAIARGTGLAHVATRSLCSSLSFLNRRNSPRPIPKRLLLLGAGYEWSLFAYVWASRRLDRWLGTRTSIYGWAFYFGRIEEPVNTDAWVNVCIRCGSGQDGSMLLRQGGVQRGLSILQTWRCPQCEACNPFFAENLVS
jgi:SAM-dependent methyltransferase